jgi:membrane dipeptidase
MHFFDAHCDTVMRTFDSGLDFVNGGATAHLDLPRMLGAGVRLQLFAVFVSEREMPGRDLRAYADEAARRIAGWWEQSGGRLRLALTAADVHSAFADGPAYGLLGLEGADCLGDDAGNLEHFFALGIRHVIPAWSDNAFSGTVFGNQGPLTPEGARLVERCEAMGVMVDVSHLSDQAFWQVRDLTSKPFVASHSNSREVSPSPRNLTDEMIRALADRGGVMGLNLSADFVAPEYLAAGKQTIGPLWQKMLASDDAAEKERMRDEMHRLSAAIPLPGMASVVRQIRHAIDVGGEECVGLGGDLDGISQMPAPMTGVESYPLIAAALEDGGLTPRQLEKVCWRNFARVYTDVLPA